MLFNRLSRGVSRINRVVRRGAADDGWLKKNMRVEEHAGLRESTYKTYQLDFEQLLYHSVFLFIPGFLLCYGISNDLKADCTRAGHPEINFCSGPLREPMAASQSEE